MVITKVYRRCLVIRRDSPTPARWQLPAKTAGSRPDWTAPPSLNPPMAAQNEPPPKRLQEAMWGGWARGNRSSARAESGGTGMIDAAAENGEERKGGATREPDSHTIHDKLSPPCNGKKLKVKLGYVGGFRSHQGTRKLDFFLLRQTRWTK